MFLLFWRSWTSWHFGKDNDVFSSIDGVLFSNTQTRTCNSRNVVSIQIGAFPSSLTSILSFALSNTSIKALKFNSEIELLSEGSFSNNRNHIFVNLSTSVRILPKRLFVNCTSLQTVILDNFVTIIRHSSFCGCYSIQCICGGSQLIKHAEGPYIIPLLRPQCPKYYKLNITSQVVRSKWNALPSVI